VRLRAASRRPAAEELHDVYREHVGAVYAFFGYAVSREEAEDLTAATFERVVRSWHAFDPRRSGVRTWILAIARNLLTDHYRRQRLRRGAVSLDEHPALLDGLARHDDAVERRMATEVARGWLAGLTPREREVLALRYGADLSPGEVAQALDLTEANVYQISSRGLRRLREQLGGQPVSDSA
jgi:RNA polymerase sigma factor (sigma-70 family)